MNTLVIPDLFPVGSDACWSSELGPTDPLIDDWLNHTGSLTERLQSLGQEFCVTVLGEALTDISLNEQQRLDISDPQAFVREVLLSVAGTPVVFARSIIPQAMLTGRHGQLAKLGNKPLGSVIFNDPNMIRDHFELAVFDKNTAVNHLSQSLGQTPEGLLWGRRSQFHCHEHKLMVTEIFLPQAPMYASKVS